MEGRKEGKGGRDDLWIFWPGIWKTLERAMVDEQRLIELMKKGKGDEWNQNVQRLVFLMRLLQRESLLQRTWQTGDSPAAWWHEVARAVLQRQPVCMCLWRMCQLMLWASFLVLDFSDSLLQHSCCVGPAPGCNYCYIYEAQMYRIHLWLWQGRL